jgi:predicted DNA-binding transcriptional regulator AlpA
VTRVNTDDLTDPAGVARIIGLENVNGVSVYRKRYHDFPRPVVERGRCLLWRRHEIEAWAKRRRSRPAP